MAKKSFWDKLFGTSNTPSKVEEKKAETSEVVTEASQSDDKSETNSSETKPSENKSENEETMKNEKAKIYNLIIVDESGSMDIIQSATLSGINETINTIRSAQEEFAETQEHTLTLVTFDSGTKKEDVRVIINNKPISEVEEFKDYKPNGCTPLYDALGKSLTTLHAKIKDDENATAVVTVLTDGWENSSREWNSKMVRQLIEKLKEEGWSFSYMGSDHNVKEVTDLLSIENVVEFSHDQNGASNTWERERSSRRAYYDKIDMMYNGKSRFSKQEKLNMKRQFAKEYYAERVTPNHVTHLEPNEIFVFGTNANGNHTGEAGSYAVQNFGAVNGQAEGLQGQSYAIPTSGGFDEMIEAVYRFTEFAAEHSELRFLVTPIGCGGSGYDAWDVARLFRNCIHLENVALPLEFWEVLGLRMFK